LFSKYCVSLAKVVPLGMVTHAERAHLGEAAASAGSTVFDGDQFSTEAGGALRITGSSLRLQLDAQSMLTLRRPAEDGAEADLASGTLVFSMARNGSIKVVANEASIQPAANAATVAHVRVVNPKELRIHAQRGGLEFSYHGESEVIAEGSAYRVLLDPSEKELAAFSDSEEARKKPGKPHTKFLLLVIAIAAGVAIPVLMHALESPDRPGPASVSKMP